MEFVKVLHEGTHCERLCAISELNYESPEDLLGPLIDLLQSESDVKLLYLASKAIIDLNPNTEDYYTSLVQCLKTCVDQQLWCSVTQILDLLCHCTKKDVFINCLPALTEIWTPLYHTLISTNPSQATTLHAFLHLWKKLIKKKHQFFIKSCDTVTVLLSLSEVSLMLKLEAMRVLCRSLPAGDDHLNVGPPPNICVTILSRLLETLLAMTLSSAVHCLGGSRSVISQSYGDISSCHERVDAGDPRVAQYSALLVLKAGACYAITDPGLVSSSGRMLSDRCDLLGLFRDQDNLLIEAMLCCLLTCERLAQNCPDTGFNPHLMFLSFLDHHAAWDHQLLLDLLTSPETCFLLLLTKYLKLAIDQWRHFCCACGCEPPSSSALLVEYSDSEEESVSDTTLDKVMSVFIRLRLVIERLHEAALFPYNPKSLLCLLHELEELYEK